MALRISSHQFDELQQYLATLPALPRLSAQEEHALLSRLHLARLGQLPAEDGLQAKQRLVEGNLALVISIVLRYHAYTKHLTPADLIQEGSLGVLRALDSYDLTTARGKFSGYVGSGIRHALDDAMALDDTVQVSKGTLHYLRETRRLGQVKALQPVSLDVQAAGYKHTLAYFLPSPALVLPDADPCPQQQAKRQQVEALLACLNPRQQQVVRLRFGLEEEDGHAYTFAEIGRKLGITPATAKNIGKYALARLRSRGGGGRQQARMQRQQERTAAKQARAAQRQAEQEARLPAALAELQAQGKHIDMMALAQAARVDTQVAAAYLRTVWGTQAERLGRAYAQLQAQGAKITLKRLSQTARVRESAASDFLHAQRGTVRQGDVPRQKRGVRGRKRTQAG